MAIPTVVAINDSSSDTEFTCFRVAPINLKAA